MTTLKGECACGKINVEMPPPDHVAMCRRVVDLPRSELKVSGGTTKSWSKPGDSGGMVQHYFCADCGSPLWADAESYPGVSCVRAGLLPPHEVPKPISHIYAKNMESWEPVIKDIKVYQKLPGGP